MSTSGTRRFDPTFAELMSEAFSRCLIPSVKVTQEHITEAVRSANLMLVTFATLGVNQFQLTAHSIPTDGSMTYELPEGTIDVWSAVHRESNADTTIDPVSRADYHTIPKKDQTGDRPNIYFVDRGKVGDADRTITFWPVPNAGSTIELWVWRRAEDAVRLPETLSVAWEGFEAYAAALTARLAEKYNPAAYEQKQAIADMRMKQFLDLGRERAPTRIRIGGYAS